MGADTQALDGIYKEFYEDYVSEGVNNKNPLKDLFKPQEIEYGGREVVWNAHVGRNPGVMATGEGSALPAAGNQKSIQARATAKKIIGRVELTPEAIADSTKSEYAFVSARKDEMNRLIDDFARRNEHYLVGTGTGVLGLVNEVTPTGNTTLIMDSPGGIANTNFGNRFVQPGMVVALVNPATGALRASSAKTVTACAASGANITISAAPSNGADNDYVVQAANESVTDILDTSFQQAPMGIMGLIDDGTYVTNYFGIDRTLYPNYAAYVKASTGAFSTDVIQQSADVVDQKLNGKTTRMLMEHSTRRLLIQATDADRRYIGAQLMRPDSGTAAMKQGDLTLGEIPVTVIRDFPLDVIMGLDEEGMDAVQYVSEKGKWVDEDGSILTRQGSGSSATHKFEAWYYQRFQNVVRNPGLCWRNDGITGQTVIVTRAE
jgi:hypothetical protein